MRIVQLIDSLETGGAEKMAVTYANSLAKTIEFSGLIATRKEGELKGQLSSKVNYHFLDRKTTLDFKALFALRKYVMSNRAEILHAHSSSFLLAVLLKLTFPKIKIVWHDHYGNSEFLDKRKAGLHQLCSILFSRVIVVNHQLLDWAKSKLHCSKIIYLPNFTVEEETVVPSTVLRGNEGKRILCLANLRPQKNHQMLLDAAQQLMNRHPEWSFHLVGKDFIDDYSSEIKSLIKSKNLCNHVFLYGSRNDVSNILRQSDVGVLTSKSEGLPVSLLEYGFHKLPVVVTNVGEISNIIDSENGLLVNSCDSDGFFAALCNIIENERTGTRLALHLHKTIVDNYSEKAILGNYFALLKDN